MRENGENTQPDTKRGKSGGRGGVAVMKWRKDANTRKYTHTHTRQKIEYQKQQEASGA